MSRALEMVLDALFMFGKVTGSTQSARVRNVLLALTGNTTNERHTDQTPWIASPLYYRPAAGGGEEFFGIRRGDEVIVLGTRDTRWQVSIDEGDVVIRALAQNGARIRLTASGEIACEGGPSQASFKLVRDDLLQAELTKITTTLGTGSNGAGAVVFGTPYVKGTTATERVKVDR